MMGTFAINKLKFRRGKDKHTLLNGQKLLRMCLKFKTYHESKSKYSCLENTLSNALAPKVLLACALFPGKYKFLKKKCTQFDNNFIRALHVFFRFVFKIFKIKNS